MRNKPKKLSRKKFLLWGVGVTSLLAIPAILRFPKKKKKSKTVKMLTQDGRLVEIEVADIPSKKQKIKEGGIFTWVNKKTSSI